MRNECLLLKPPSVVFIIKPNRLRQKTRGRGTQKRPDERKSVALRKKFRDQSGVDVAQRGEWGRGRAGGRRVQVEVWQKGREMEVFVGEPSGVLSTGEVGR